MTNLRFEKKREEEERRRRREEEEEKKPYYHPILEEQVIIRFPPDIAARINQLMDEEKKQPNFLNIKFRDEHNAIVHVFEQELPAVLVSLPTLVESHKTVDGMHLFKSADISQMLIVHRPGDDSRIRQDYMAEDGLTPPTSDIFERRKARSNAVNRKRSEEKAKIEGISYWEMVEVQLQVLLSKEKTAKPVCRKEFLEEPEEDPVILEKVLRSQSPEFFEKFRGYSGQVISDDEIELYQAKTIREREPVLEIPSEIWQELKMSEEQEEEIEMQDAERGSEEESQRAAEEEDDLEALLNDIDQEKETKSETSVSEASENEEEEEEEEDVDEATLREKERRLEMIKHAIGAAQSELQGTENEYQREKLRSRIANLSDEQAKLERQLAEERAGGGP